MAKKFSEDDLGIGIGDGVCDKLEQNNLSPSTPAKSHDEFRTNVLKERQTKTEKTKEEEEITAKGEEENRPIGCKVSDEMLKRIKIRIAQEDIKLKDFIKAAIEQRLNTPLENN